LPLNLLKMMEKRILSVYKEYESLKNLSLENTMIRREDKVLQKYYWVPEIDYEGHKLNILECLEEKKKKITRFVWLTNFPLSEHTCNIIAKGGRLRWKIENEGFNTQKNGGYGLEHPYSKDSTAFKNFYFLL